MPWKSPKKTCRRKAILRESPQCFLDPRGVGATKGRPRYYVCKAGKVTCEGLKAARRRAILQGEAEFENRAIRRAKLLGCPWARQSKLRVPGSRKARKVA